MTCFCVFTKLTLLIVYIPQAIMLFQPLNQAISIFHIFTYNIKTRTYFFFVAG